MCCPRREELAVRLDLTEARVQVSAGARRGAAPTVGAVTRDTHPPGLPGGRQPAHEG